MDKYKDLPEIIADMLIKQDQTIDAVKKLSEKIGEINDKIEGTNGRIDSVIGTLNTTNNILQNFTDVSVKQWEQQAIFNERFYDKLDRLEKNSEKTAETLTTIEESIQRLENR